MPTTISCLVHGHPLSLKTSVYKNGNFICNLCFTTSHGLVYHCMVCNVWDAHVGCLMKEKEKETEQNRKET